MVPAKITSQPAARSKTRTALKLLMVIMWSCLVGWLLLEVFMRVGFDLLPAETQGVVQHVRRVPWDEEHIIPVLPFIGSREFHARIAPGLKDYRVHWGDAKFTFDTIALWGDTEGFRTNPPEWPLDIAAVGDSFTFCWTDFEDCWVEQLHHDFGWHVVNLGIPGTGSMAHRNILEAYVPPMEPDIVIWQWFGNDYKDDYDFGRIRGDVDELNAPPPSGEALPDYGKLAEYSTVYRWLRDTLHRRVNPPANQPDLPTVNGREISISNGQGSHDFQYESVQYGWTETLRAIEESQIILDGIDAEMVIVLIPTKEESFAKHITGYLDTDYLTMLNDGRKRLLATCAERSWRCIDMLAEFQQAIDAGQTVYNAFDFHLDASGNQLVTDAVGAYLIENGLLEPR